MILVHLFTLSDVGFCNFITHSFSNRSQDSGIVHSKHLFEEPRYIPTHIKEWYIHTEKDSYIVFRFDFFDVSCHSTHWIHTNLQTLPFSFCNLNKPLQDIIKSDNHMTIYFDPPSRLSALVEGFSGSYEARYRPNTAVGLITEEQKGIV